MTIAEAYKKRKQLICHINDLHRRTLALLNGTADKENESVKSLLYDTEKELKNLYELTYSINCSLPKYIIGDEPLLQLLVEQKIMKLRIEMLNETLKAASQSGEKRVNSLVDIDNMVRQLDSLQEVRTEIDNKLRVGLNNDLVPLD